MYRNSLKCTIWGVMMLSLFLPIVAHLQSVEGQLRNQDNQPLPWATIRLVECQNQSFITGVVSNIEGYFHLNLPQKDSLRLQIQLLGYKFHTISIAKMGERQQYDLGIIKLNEAVNELATVTVKGERKALVTIPGGYQINNSAELSLVNASAQSLLRQAPGVSIHSLHGLAIMGKTNIQVKVDGKNIPLAGRELVSFLQELSAEEVKSIRVVTNPSAGEAAAGSGGRIEILTSRKDRKGFLAQTSAEMSSGNKVQGGIAAIFNTEKLSVYARLTGKDQQFRVFEEDYYEDFRDGVAAPYYDYQSQHTEYINSWGQQASIDYSLKENTTIGFLFRYNDFQQINKQGHNSTSFFDKNRDLQSIKQVTTTSDFKNKRYYYNTSYRSDLGKKGQFLKADYALTIHDRYNGIQLQADEWDPSMTEKQDSYGSLNLANYDVYLHKGQLDYEMALNPQHKMEMGSRLDHVLVDNNFNNVQRLSGVGIGVTELKYRENIWAFYLNFKGNQGNFFYEMGGRAEHTNLLLSANQQTEETVYGRNRWNFFPSLLMKYQLNENESLSLNLSKRIDRPPYYVLNPYNYNPNPNIIDQGNPGLAPALDHRIDATYSPHWSNAISSVFAGGFSWIKDFYAYITEENEQGQFINSPLNIQAATEAYASLYTSYTPTEWWTISSNLLVSKMGFNGQNVDLQAVKPIASYSISLGQQFDLGNEFSAQVQAEYTSAQTTLYGQGNGYQTIDISLGKTFFGQLKCQLEMTDVFNIDDNRWIFRSPLLRYRGRWKYETQVATVRLKWRFGKLITSKAKRHKVQQDERYEGR